LDACVERIERAREALVHLTQELDALSQLVSELQQDDEEGADDLQDLLRLHHEEVIGLLAGSRDAAAEPGTPEFPFRLDPLKREARIGRRRMYLTPKEFAVLELLWEQMPAPVSRETIFDRLYGEKRGRSERVVDVHVHNIRQKLKAAGTTNATIQSKTGAGWSLHLHLSANQEVLHPGLLGQPTVQD